MFSGRKKPRGTPRGNISRRTPHGSVGVGSRGRLGVSKTGSAVRRNNYSANFGYGNNAGNTSSLNEYVSPAKKARTDFFQSKPSGSCRITMPKTRTPAQQARFEKIQARMGKKVSSTAKAVSPAKAKPTKKRASTPKPTPKRKRTSLSNAKTPEERTAIINARMGKTPEATKKQRKPASSRKKKERAVSKKAASKKKKPSRAKVYQNPEDSEEDNERVENSLYDSKEEGKGHRHHNSDIDGSDVEEEIVERTTTKITTTIRKKKGSMSSTRRTTSNSTKRTVDGRGSFLVTANLFLIAAVVACAFYLCMPMI